MKPCTSETNKILRYDTFLCFSSLKNHWRNMQPVCWILESGEASWKSMPWLSCTG